jgi:tellurite resistance protein TerC
MFAYMSLNQEEVLLFGAFGIVIILFLVVDLGLLNRTAHKISYRSALYQSIFWVTISLVYAAFIYFYDEGGKEKSLLFLSAYFTEKALSVDNIFVIILILKYFSVKEEYYHKILFWGILGAIVFRAVFIFLGALLIAEFHWILYIFGIFLVYSGIKIWNDEDEMEIEPERNPLLNFARRFLRISKEERGGAFFFTGKDGKFYFTYLFLVIILIESTDLIFAVDSIPAAFAITQNEFIVYTSNIFAVMGLRAMFFLLAGVLDRFYLLQKGLSFILIFIGLKMLMEILHIHVPIYLSFVVIIATLTLSIVLSLIFKKESKKEVEITAPISDADDSSHRLHKRENAV